MIDPSLPSNFTFIRQYKGKKPIYDVEMASVSESRAIRDSFGAFWRKKSGKRLPDGLKGITIANSTTFPTRVRVRLLKELARKHSLANPELTCFVTSYYPRPELKIRSRRSPMVTMKYTEAITKLSHHLSIEFLTELYEYARSVLPDEEIVERFIVLSPDLLKPNSGHADLSTTSTDEPQNPQAMETASEETDQAEVDAPSPTQGTSSGFAEVKKKNKDRFFKDKKKTTPYSKSNK
jgi:hypothetical protein